MPTKQRTGSANPGFAHISKRSRKGSDAIGVGDGRVAGADERLALRWVRGISSNLDDIVLRGEKLRAHLGDALLNGTLVRTMGGASSLVLTVSDPGRQLVERGLLTEPHTLELDGLRFSYVKLASEGINAPLSITYIPEVVADLMAIKGPHKALRAKVTRAEFCKRLALMAKPPPRFICPELHKIQPVAKASEAKAAANEALDERRGGIDVKANLTVKGVKATPAQIQAGDRALRVAEAEGAPPLAKVAMMLALIVESVLGAAASNWYEAEPFVAPHTNHSDLEAMTKLFLNGYAASEPGAIGTAKVHPDWHPYQVTQAVQKSGAGAASDGASNYGPWTDEAREWVQEFGGADSTATAVTVVPYAFKQQKDESNWKCMNEKAKEVNWRCFESAGWIYFMAEPTLLAQRLRMRVGPHAEGIQDIAFDYDLGKKVQQIKLTAWAHAWEAPPGTAVAVTGCGPANGVYLVQTISSPLTHGSSTAEITLKRPTKPLPEPAPTRKESTVTFGGGSNSGMPDAVQKIIAYIDEATAKGTNYVWGGGHGSFGSPSAGKDCSGFVSAAVHAGGFLKTPVTSGEFANLFPHGVGEWVTIYGDAKHVFMKVKYPDGHWRFAGTGGPTGSGGWVPTSNTTSGEPGIGSKVASHPPGL